MNRLNDISKIFNWLDKKFGIVPFNLFKERSKSSNSVKLLKEFGIVPLNSLTAKPIIINWFKLPNLFGIVPVNKLTTRFKNFNLVKLSKCGIFPVNLLNARSKIELDY